MGKFGGGVFWLEGISVEVLGDRREFGLLEGDR